ncbi:NYN domain-containing protein [Corynebacterium timonense]|uniref:NYN domain-containing protein n=1 Tax=Corynebacterium timonense TaxID=441500 RepID=A0A1H1UV19_9CORY|nr:NYN domain-containing protein [Corynebacterium timonense]SDS76303.1 NYN domain-containing protein [Corynebacterium timonense]
MLERTLVFVDTSYLLASFYNSWEIGARSQLEIDLPEVVATLREMVTHQLNQPIHRQFWYDGIPESGPHRYQRALRTCDGVQLRTGQLIEWGERRTQKGVDTRLVADLVIQASQGNFSDFVLVSGDADMIPGVEEAANYGVRVHLYGFGWDSMSSALRHACDTTTILDPREDFACSMQLQVLEGPLPPTIRERPLGDAEPLDADEGPAPVPMGNPLAPREPDEEHHPEPSAGDTGSERPAPSETTHPAPATEPEEEPSEAEAEVNRQVPHPKPAPPASKPAPKPSMMAPRRKLRSRYVPLPEEVWSSAGFQTPFDVGQQYATWWYENAASSEQRDNAHMLSGGGLPPEIDRPLLQFACETLHEYTLSEHQRVSLRDGFHAGIRGVLLNLRNSH